MTQKVLTKSPSMKVAALPFDITKKKRFLLIDFWCYLLLSGDIITVLQEDDGGWWQGSVKGMTGLFPSNFIEPHNEPVTLHPSL